MGILLMLKYIDVGKCEITILQLSIQVFCLIIGLIENLKYYVGTYATHMYSYI